MIKHNLKSAYYLIGFLLLCLLLPSCNGTKYLKEGQQLYLGSEIKFDPDAKGVNSNKLETDLNKKLIPKPNKKFLGLFQLRVWAYLKLEPKKDKGFKYWLRNKIGKEPVLISDVDIEQKKKVLAKAMQDNGFFDTEVTAEVKARKRNDQAVKVHYTLSNDGPTYIDTFIIPPLTKEHDSVVHPLDSLLNAYPDYEVKSNDIYNLEHIQKDRDGLSFFIRSHGYYDFNKNDLIYLVDTSDYQQFDVRLVVRKPQDSLRHQKFYIRDVNIYPSYNDSATGYWRATNQYPVEGVRNTSKLAEKIENNPKGKYFSIYEHHPYITRKVIAENVFIEPGDQFSIYNFKLTSGRLVNLGLYKFVNIDYSKVGNDSLDVTIKLTPTKYQNFKTSIELSSSTLGYLGSTFSVKYNNRNTSRKAIDLTLQAGVGTEFQFSNRKAELNILDANIGLSFSVPRRLRFYEEKLKSPTPPTTTFGISENFQIWLQYYTINDINLNYTYSWQRRDILNKPSLTHELSPINFSWLFLINTTSTFDDLLNTNAQLRASFQNNFIIGSKYQLTINTKKGADQNNYFLLLHSIESSGNLAYAVAKAIKRNQADQYQIFSIPFSQFGQIEIDYRNYWIINRKSQFISRINTGVGISYGNTLSLPYSRQYFVGGPNTIRGFSIRDIGPGSYASDNNENNNNSVEQTGDLKILFNLEYRWTIYKFIRAATFVDAGNVWLLRNDPDRPGGQINRDFYKEIGLSSGLGLRLDFNFVAIRLDLGIPLYKPFEPEGERWFHQTPASTFKEWRKSNWVWNFAIGYPF
ncbi:MAG: BamA/TamA family outer membrane protein [Bacteroidetes bacterium]|nr:BamA/TamA family outer membrane protein [Bacteroidota bacterium]